MNYLLTRKSFTESMTLNFFELTKAYVSFLSSVIALIKCLYPCNEADQTFNVTTSENKLKREAA